MKYRTFIIEHDDKTGAYKYNSEEVLNIKKEYLYADTIEEAKREIDEFLEFDSEDILLFIKQHMV